MKSYLCTLHRLYCVTVHTFLSCHYATSLNSSQWSYVYIHTYTYACMHRYIKYIIKIINTSQCTYTSHCHFQMLKQSLLWNTISLSCYCPHTYNILLCIPFVCAILVHYLHLDVSSHAARTPFWLRVPRNRCLWACRTASCRLAGERGSA